MTAKKYFNKLVKFLANLTLNQIRFAMWFVVGLIALVLSPTMSPLIARLLCFLFGLIIIIWSFSWLYEDDYE